jgi:hypothetical protein
MSLLKTMHKWSSLEDFNHASTHRVNCSPQLLTNPQWLPIYLPHTPSVPLNSILSTNQPTSASHAGNSRVALWPLGQLSWQTFGLLWFLSDPRGNIWTKTKNDSSTSTSSWMHRHSATCYLTLDNQWTSTTYQSDNTAQHPLRIKQQFKMWFKFSGRWDLRLSSSGKIIDWLWWGETDVSELLFVPGWLRCGPWYGGIDWG